jgi:hypothetical protein
MTKTDEQLQIAKATVAQIWWADVERKGEGWKISTTVPTGGASDVIIDHGAGSGPEKLIEAFGTTFADALNRVLAAGAAPRADDPKLRHAELLRAAKMEPF